MSTVNNSDVASTSHNHSFPVTEQAEAQGRRASFSDGSIDPAIYKNIFNEDPLEETGYHSEANPQDNVEQFSAMHDTSTSSIQNGGDRSLPDNTTNQENGQHMGFSFFQTRNRADMMGVASGHLGGMQNGIRNDYSNHEVSAHPQTISTGDQTLRQTPSTAESNMALQPSKATTSGFAPSPYDQRAHSGLAKTQAAVTPAPALSPAHQTMKDEPEASHIQRDLEAVASMYNMGGKGNNSNSSMADPPPNAAASQPSAGPSISVTRQENSTVASGNGITIRLLDDDVDDAIAEIGLDPNERNQLLNMLAFKGKIVGTMVFGDAKAITRTTLAAAEAAIARRSSMPDRVAKRSLQQSSQHMQQKTMNNEPETSQIQRDLEAVASMYNMEEMGNNSSSSMAGPRSNAVASQLIAGPATKSEPETSQIQRDLEAVASMYNMEGQGNHSNSSMAGPRPNAVASQPSAGPAIAVSRRESTEGIVIELLDDDVDDGIVDSGTWDDPNKRRKLINGAHLNNTEKIARAKQAAAEAAAARRTSMPDWMAKRSLQQSQQQMQRKAVPIQRPTAMVPKPAMVSSGTGIGRSVSVIHEPTFFDLPDGFVPTWQQLYPMMRRPQKAEHKFFELSLLNVQEFTITGLPLSEGMTPTPVTGLRSKIKEISKPHGKSVFEKDKEGVGGKWRIPLGAYRAFFSYLNSDVMTRVIGIPENQLKIASLGKARLERGFPSVGKLMAKGVPRGLATTLAPFQRGGVDFVAERNGRALIADEMGLGKTIQSIASLSMYWEEWPLLILTPSSARYHWENEFRHWLGVDSGVNNNMGNENGLDFGGEDASTDEKEEFDLAALDARTMPLLNKSQINVLTSSKDQLFPTADTKVVICSYGLAPTLVEKQQITPGLFRCAIVDESHMLKNMKSQRTSRLVPILHATNRCILLSGTPAFARPSELFPQLKILSTERDTWWGDERLFVQKYVKRTTPARRAELFAMLTGTIMIRRLKADILKSMPKKIREKVLTDVVSPAQRREFHKCMQMLREGKGVLGQLAKEHSALDTVEDHESHAVALSSEKSNSRQDTNRARAELVQQYQQQFQDRMTSVHYGLNANRHQLNPTQQQHFVEQQQYRIRLELDSWYKEQLHKLNQADSMVEEEEDSRKQVLNRMYTLTATAKIPFITEMIKQWLADPTKGKLCVFAHHKFVLNDLIKLTGLSNETGSTKRYIRIDGSTTPKLRQAQITTFQTDPDVRIAILGITAAGVAVTLTAASTVWFAELFWTPALMIQAEDRCHRIGQNSRVNCLYFVAKGTLDELLWKLLERKFRDLGEFVEGKEKMKIVVDKIYHGEKEFRSIFNKPEDDESIEPMNFEDIDEDTGESLFDLDEDIVGEITMLGNEEMTKSLAPQGDDDGPEPQPKMADGSTTQTPPEKKAAKGSSEDDAIDLLSDDEDDQPSAPASGPSQTAASNTEQVVSSAKEVRPADRCYNQLFDGPKYEMQLVLYQGRPIVAQRTTTTPSKPALGDVLVAVNGSTLPMLSNINQISLGLKNLISKGSVELTFREFSGLKEHLKRDAQRPPQQQILASRPTQNHGSNEVIELSDDDD